MKGLHSLGGILFWDSGMLSVVMGACGPLTSLHPWDSGIPEDLQGFYKWVFDSLQLLNQVVF